MSCARCFLVTPSRARTRCVAANTPPLPPSLSILLTSRYRHARALQESLVTIFNRIEAVREEHDKLDNNNKFLQKYIGDLMTTSKITATGSRTKK